VLTAPDAPVADEREWAVSDAIDLLDADAPPPVGDVSDPAAPPQVLDFEFELPPAAGSVAAPPISRGPRPRSSGPSSRCRPTWRSRWFR
jgi:hypothetical protein